MKNWPGLLPALALALLLGACAAAPPAAPVDRLFADHLFKPPAEPVDATEVFAVSPEMKDYLATTVGVQPGHKGRQQALADALRNKAQLKLDYDGAYTRNAAQAFAARSGNCLSLVIMTAALAKQMGIPVRFQNVYVDETWSRLGDLYFSAGHVNLSLGGKPPEIGSRLDDGEQLTIDFMPPEDLRGSVWRSIHEATVLAMYMNNRAAEALATNQLDDAYWYAREAARQDPGFITVYNTLGVVYLRSGHLHEAEQALAFGLQREPANANLMSNMVNVLQRQGRVEEAKQFEDRLARLEPNPPFAFFSRGVLAMDQGNYRGARDLFTKEVERAPYYHEFHFWLALALVKLGDNQKAKQQLALAMENSTTRSDHDLYAAKLERIKAIRMH
jgi:tetratricopeptide (TPR) repeat protein